MCKKDTRITDAYSEPCQTSMTEHFAKIVNDILLLIIFEKSLILDVGEGPEYAFVLHKNEAKLFTR